MVPNNQDNLLRANKQSLVAALGGCFLIVVNIYKIMPVDSDTFAVMPIYYQVARRQGSYWAFIHGDTFYNHYNLPRFSIEDTFKGFGTSLSLVAREFFRINGGKEGYYLANILEKQYYYCGENPYDVKVKLNELGIIKPE